MSERWFGDVQEAFAESEPTEVADAGRTPSSSDLRWIAGPTYFAESPV